MSNIVGIDGKPLIAEPPPGFYVCGQCPVCSGPIFYHGGGQYTVIGNALGPGRVSFIQPNLYSLCDCLADQNMEGYPAEIPPIYDLLAERNALDALFRSWYTLRNRYVAAMEQLKEFMDERVPEAATTDQSDAIDGGDSL